MRLSKKALIVDYLKVFGSEAGKNVLEDLKKRAPLVTGGVDTSKGIDVEVLLVHEGRADVVKHIYKMLGTDLNEEREQYAKGE